MTNTIFDASKIDGRRPISILGQNSKKRPKHAEEFNIRGIWSLVFNPTLQIQILALKKLSLDFGKYGRLTARRCQRILIHDHSIHRILTSPSALLELLVLVVLVLVLVQVLVVLLVLLVLVLVLV